MYEMTLNRVMGKGPDIRNARNEWDKTKSKGTLLQLIKLHPKWVQVKNSENTNVCILEMNF